MESVISPDDKHKSFEDTYLNTYRPKHRNYDKENQERANKEASFWGKLMRERQEQGGGSTCGDSSMACDESDEYDDNETGFDSLTDGECETSMDDLHNSWYKTHDFHGSKKYKNDNQNYNNHNNNNNNNNNNNDNNDKNDDNNKNQIQNLKNIIYETVFSAFDPRFLFFFIFIFFPSFFFLWSCF